MRGKSVGSWKGDWRVSENGGGALDFTRNMSGGQKNSNICNLFHRCLFFALISLFNKDFFMQRMLQENVT
jgi:hypothetical protein